MNVQDLMVTNLVTIAPTESADTAWTTLDRDGQSHLVVQDRDRILGVLSAADVDAPGLGETLVRDLITQLTEMAEPGMTPGQVAEVMQRQQVEALPVMNDGRLVGLITIDQLPDRVRTPARWKPQDWSPQVDSPRRAPFVGQNPRETKQDQGRTGPGEVPAHIYAAGDLQETVDQDLIRRKLGRKLSKFATSIDRVSVRLEDINGPRGGVDKRCHIKVVLSDLPSVVVEEENHDLTQALEAALHRTESAVRRAVDKRRTSAIRSQIEHAREVEQAAEMEAPTDLDPAPDEEAL